MFIILFITFCSKMVKNIAYLRKTFYFCKRDNNAK